MASFTRCSLRMVRKFLLYDVLMACDTYVVFESTAWASIDRLKSGLQKLALSFMASAMACSNCSLTVVEAVLEPVSVEVSTRWGRVFCSASTSSLLRSNRAMFVSYNTFRWRLMMMMAATAVTTSTASIMRQMVW